MNRYNIGLLNVNKRFSRYGDELFREMERRELDFGLFTEVKMRPGLAMPLRGVVASALSEKTVEEMNANPIGGWARNGVVCVRGPHLQQETNIEPRILITDPVGRWLVMDFSGVVIILVYLSPSVTIEILQQLTTIINNHSTNNQPVIILGDFNINLKRFGDTRNITDSQKKDWIENMLDNEGWSRINPIRGRFTTAGRRDNMGGGGVTDLIIVNNAATHLVQDLIIHDGADGDNIYPHSDHHLLSFNIYIPSPVIPVGFKRLNIRKLRDKAREYEKELRANMLDVKKQLRLALVSLSVATHTNTPLSYEYRQGLINAADDIVIDWFLSAAYKIGGTLKFQQGASTAPIAEDHVEQIRGIYEELHSTAVRMSRTQSSTRETRLFMWDKVRMAKKVLHTAKIRSGKRLFEAAADNYARDAAGDAKRLACAMARAERTKSALDPTKIEQYVQHFRSTFGHTPTATATLDEEILKLTDPQADFVPREQSVVMEFISSQDVVKLCNTSPNGKACGADGLYGELVSLCPDTAGHVLTDFFWLITALNCTPTSWQTALVALVWKKKGSNTDIANYRPISLCSRIRMLYEGAIKPHLERIIEANCDIAQGGFRPGRSTLDQVIGLHEIIARHKGKLKVAYLDIKAAYDCVDRRLLWSQLANVKIDDKRTFTYTVLIPLLRILFDCNVAKFLVQGQISNPLEVTRGLLQGTVLAPMLFTLFINDLPRRLRERHQSLPLDHRTSRQNRESELRINSLFFADDAALAARSLTTLQAMMDTAYEWAIETGTTWAPPKCEAVGLLDHEVLTLGGEPIPHYERKTYLGVDFSAHGVELLETILKRVRKAEKVLQFLKSRGFNGLGMRALAGRRIYFLFIRSVAEYATCLKILTAVERKPLERLQQKALSTLFSVGIRTAATSMRILLGVQTIEARNQLLHAQFIKRIHTCNDDNNTAVIIYRSTINTNKPRGCKIDPSLLRPGVKDNPRWQSLNLEIQPLQKPTINPYIFGSFTEKKNAGHSLPIDKDTRNIWYHEDVSKELNRIKNDPRGARTSLLLSPPTEFRAHTIIQRVLPREIERPITLWMLGVAISRNYCNGCSTEINYNKRQHAVLCSELGQRVLELYEEPPVTIRDDIYEIGGTDIDQALSDPRTFYFPKEDPLARQATVRGLTTLARLIDQITAYYTGHQRILSPSAAKAKDEVRELLASIPEQFRVRRFNTLRRHMVDIIRKHFAPVTARKIRPPRREVSTVHLPELPDDDAVNEVLNSVHGQNLLAQLDPG